MAWPPRLTPLMPDKKVNQAPAINRVLRVGNEAQWIVFAVAGEDAAMGLSQSQVHHALGTGLFGRGGEGASNMFFLKGERW